MVLSEEGRTETDRQCERRGRDRDRQTAREKREGQRQTYSARDLMVQWSMRSHVGECVAEPGQRPTCACARVLMYASRSLGIGRRVYVCVPLASSLVSIPSSQSARQSAARSVKRPVSCAAASRVLCRSAPHPVHHVASPCCTGFVPGAGVARPVRGAGAPCEHVGRCTSEPGLFGGLRWGGFCGRGCCRARPPIRHLR